MAKKTKTLNPLPIASLSDEEEAENLSGEEEEVEDEISDDSSSKEDEPKDHVKVPSVKKPKASSSALPGRTIVSLSGNQGSDSDSGSETERDSSPSKSGSKKAVDIVKSKKSKEKEVQGLPLVKSGKKRPSEKSATEVHAKRAKKVSADDDKKIVEGKKKPNFQRLWSEEDEIALLEGMIDYEADTGKSPHEDIMNGFYEFVKKSISFEASKNQLGDKIRSLKKKYMGKKKRDEESYSKAHDKECLKLIKYIWGSDGMALESAIKSNVKTRKSERKLDSLEANSKEAEEDKEVLIHGGDSQTSDWFENSFLVRSIASFGVDEYSVKQRWSTLPMKTKKRIEEKWKLLQAKEFEIVLQKTDFLNEVTSLIGEARSH